MSETFRTGAQAILPGVEWLMKENVAAATEMVISKAVADFEAELRKRIAATAVQTSAFYELSMNRENLVITIKDFKAGAPKTQG